jgi:biopolymer transport protein ExbD
LSRVKLVRKHKRTPRIEIIPMVDVMFLLLVFYILSSLALHHQRGIAVSLPMADSSDPGGANEDFVLSISATGDFFLDKTKVPSAKLGDALNQWAHSLPGGVESAKKTSVVLNADLKTEHRYVVQAMDELRKLGINNFVISTEPSRAGS